MTGPDREAALAALSALLDHAPAFGELGVIVHLHQGAISRIEERVAISRKPSSGGSDGQ